MPRVHGSEVEMRILEGARELALVHASAFPSNVSNVWYLKGLYL